MLLADLSPFFGVGAFGAAGGLVELLANPRGKFLRMRGADPGALFFGPTIKLNFCIHVVGFGIAGCVAFAGVSMWFVEVCHFLNVSGLVWV